MPVLSIASREPQTTPVAHIHCNLGTAELVEHAIQSGEGLLSRGALVVATGKHTGPVGEGQVHRVRWEMETSI